jgi:hypothetical protein
MGVEPRPEADILTGFTSKSRVPDVAGGLTRLRGLLQRHMLGRFTASGSGGGEETGLAVASTRETELAVAGTRQQSRFRAALRIPRPGPAATFRLLRGVPGWVVAGVVYAAGGVAMWWQVWSGHPSATMTCECGDPSSFVWYLAWPAYAISHGHSLFFSARVHVPGGMNLLDNTSVLALGVVLAPVTWLFGPIVTLNVALTAAPVLSALSAYGVLRRGLGLRWVAAFAGGLAFGASPFMLRDEAANHLQTSFLALVPLIFWCCYEIAVAQRGRWWHWGIGLGVLVAAQFFVGTEVLTVTVLTTAIALLIGVIAAWLHDVRNPGDHVLAAKLPFAWRGFVLAAAVGGVLLAYPLWFSLAGPEHINGPNWWNALGNGLMQVLLPLGPNSQDVQGWSRTGYLGPVGTFEGYVGIPALVVLAIAVVVVRRPLAKLCAAVTVITVWLSLGGANMPADTGGEPSWLWLPWSVIGRVPVLDKLTPSNFSAPVAFLVATAVALLADQLMRVRSAGPATSRVRRSLSYAVSGAVCMALVIPWLVSWNLPFTTERLAVSQWVTDKGAQLHGSAVVLFYPFPATYQDQALLWQAQSGMRYSIVGGRGIVAGQGNVADHGFTPGTPEGTMSALTTLHVPQSNVTKPPLPDSAAVASFRSALRRWGVTNVVLTPGKKRNYVRKWLTRVLGTKPRLQDGAWVWNHVRQLVS